jgi:type II secretory pathway component PulM
MLLDHPQLVALRDRYEHLERQEQLAVKALGIFFAGLFLYFGMLLPAHDFYADRLADFERNQSLLQYMKTTEVEARASASDEPGISGQNLMSDVSNSARRFGINPNRLQPEGEDGVSVWFDGVSFGLLLDWMSSVSSQNVSVRQISIDRDDASGVVNARIILRSK